MHNRLQSSLSKNEASCLLVDMGNAFILFFKKSFIYWVIDVFVFFFFKLDFTSLLWLCSAFCNGILTFKCCSFIHRPFDSKNPFLAPVTVNRRLNKAGDRHLMHLELDITGSKIRWDWFTTGIMLCHMSNTTWLDVMDGSCSVKALWITGQSLICHIAWFQIWVRRPCCCVPHKWLCFGEQAGTNPWSGPWCCYLSQQPWWYGNESTKNLDFTSSSLKHLPRKSILDIYLDLQYQLI